MDSLPDLESLRCFVLAATSNNFRSAARRAALSPAAFGARIRRLEEGLGLRLFARTTRSLALTPRGAALLPSAQRCVDAAEACVQPASEAPPVPFDVVLGSRFEVGLTWVVPALAPLERARPERRLHLVFGDVLELVPRVLSDEMHLLLTTASIKNPKLVVTPLMEIEYALVAAPRTLARKPLLRPEDAGHHRLMDLDDDLPLFRFFREARSPREAWVFREMQCLGLIGAIRARALEGIGIAVLPRFYISEDIAKGRLRVLMPSTRLKKNTLRAVWRKGQPYEGELREIARELAQRMQI